MKLYKINTKENLKKKIVKSYPQFLSLKSVEFIVIFSYTLSYPHYPQKNIGF